MKVYDPKQLVSKLRVRPGQRVRLKDADANRTFGWEEHAARVACAEMAIQLEELQYKMYADGRYGLLVVLQAIDGGGKDSTIRHVFSAFNPQGCTVTAFKAPTASELRHDYLWRIHQHVPPRGEIGVFNRSHYEDVLVVRVDSLVPRKDWEPRYEQINDFERLLTHNHIRVVKIFLQISKREQKQRFEERIKEPRKQWKFDPADLRKRAQWEAYRAAYEAMLGRCSTREAPWYVVPADRKWLRDLAVSQILLDTLGSLPLRFPAPAYNPRAVRVR